MKFLCDSLTLRPISFDCLQISVFLGELPVWMNLSAKLARNLNFRPYLVRTVIWIPTGAPHSEPWLSFGVTPDAKNDDTKSWTSQQEFYCPPCFYSSCSQSFEMGSQCWRVFQEMTFPIWILLRRPLFAGLSRLCNLETCEFISTAPKNWSSFDSSSSLFEFTHFGYSNCHPAPSVFSWSVLLCAVRW